MKSSQKVFQEAQLLLPELCPVKCLGQSDASARLADRVGLRSREAFLYGLETRPSARTGPSLRSTFLLELPDVPKECSS